MANSRLLRAPAIGEPDQAASSRRNTSEALVPPKPNELESATSMGRSRGVLGTRSMAVSRSGLSRLMVAGATLSRMARIEKMASAAPAAPLAE